MSVRLGRRGTHGTGFPKLAPWALAIFKAANTGMFRLSGGRMRVQGRPLLLLETTGARSGKRRHTTLGWFPDEDQTRRAWIIVGSGAGSAEHPAWCLNSRHPEDVWIEVGGERIAVRPESLDGAERERAWQRVCRSRRATGSTRATPIARSRSCAWSQSESRVTTSG